MHRSTTGVNEKVALNPDTFIMSLSPRSAVNVIDHMNDVQIAKIETTPILEQNCPPSGNG